MTTEQTFKDSEILRYARHDRPEVVLAWLENGADVNARDEIGNTPLHHAAHYSRNTELAPLLLSHGADVNARSKDNWTPLHLAVIRGPGCEDLVDLLLDHGANPTVDTYSLASSGWTLLDVIMRYAQLGSGRYQAIAERIRHDYPEEFMKWWLRRSKGTGT